MSCRPGRLVLVLALAAPFAVEAGECVEPAADPGNTYDAERTYPGPCDGCADTRRATASIRNGSRWRADRPVRRSPASPA